MISILFRLSESTNIKLEALPGTKAEHIRRAIDEYLQRINPIDAAASQSGGDVNE